MSSGRIIIRVRTRAAEALAALSSEESNGFPDTDEDRNTLRGLFGSGKFRLELPDPGPPPAIPLQSGPSDPVRVS